MKYSKKLSNSEEKFVHIIPGHNVFRYSVRQNDTKSFNLHK